MGISFIYVKMPEPEISVIERNHARARSLFLWSPPAIPLEKLQAMERDMAHRGDGERAMFEKLRQSMSNPNRISIDKDWHVIHYLFTRTNTLEPTHRTDDPLHNVVMGGHPISIEPGGYGPARALNPAEVARSAQALSHYVKMKQYEEVPVAEINDAKLYGTPMPGGWSKSELQPIYELILALARFFTQAHSAQEAILIGAV